MVVCNAITLSVTEHLITYLARASHACSGVEKQNCQPNWLYSKEPEVVSHGVAANPQLVLATGKSVWRNETCSKLSSQEQNVQIDCDDETRVRL